MLLAWKKSDKPINLAVKEEERLILMGLSQCSSQNLMNHKIYFHVNVNIYSQIPFKILNHNFSVPNMFLITNLVQNFCKGKMYQYKNGVPQLDKDSNRSPNIDSTCQLHNLSASHLESTEISLINNTILALVRKLNCFLCRASDVLEVF